MALNFFENSNFLAFLWFLHIDICRANCTISYIFEETLEDISSSPQEDL